jgi:hypothetical protein
MRLIRFTSWSLTHGPSFEQFRIADLLGRWLLHDAPFRTLSTPASAERPAQRLLVACRSANRTVYRQA